MKSFWKKIILTAVSLVLCAAVIIVPLPRSNVFAAATARTTDYLNLREGVGLDKRVILTLTKGAEVTILDNSDSSWAKVKTTSGKEGYCHKDYLIITNDLKKNTASAQTAESKEISAITTSNLNMRQGAGTQNKIITTFSKGTTLKVLLSDNSAWVKVVSPDGKQGYCNSEYLDITSSPSKPNKPSNQIKPKIPDTKPKTGNKPDTQNPIITAKTKDYLNMREGPGLNYKVIVTVTKGASLKVLDNSNSQWAKVQSESGKQGYCSKEYLDITVSNPDTKSVENNTPPAAKPPNEDTETNTIVGATVTADLLRFRESPSLTARIITNLPKNTGLKVLDTSNPEWTKVQTSNGQTGYVSTQYIKILYSNDVSTDSGTNATGLSLSTNLQTVPAGKTLYIKADVTPSGTYLNWTSSNTSVATVSNGYVYAVSPGTAVITASSGAASATCNVTVTEAEPVKTAYASPNIAGIGTTVTLTAVTDNSRDGVNFVINLVDGTTRTMTADSCVQETVGNTVTKKWTVTTTFDKQGDYSFTAYSSKNLKMSNAGFKSNAFVSSNSDFKSTSNEERRVSDKMIDLIAKWEGYRSTVYADMLTANQVPTIGYGCTFGQNAQFYNNMTKTEAWSMLVNKINNSYYTTELNRMIQNNNFLMNQYQADCLISFAYNVGAGYFNSRDEMDFRRIMKNAVVPPTISPGNSIPATVTMNTVMRNAPGLTCAEIGQVSNGTQVNVTECSFSEPQKGWYKVRLSNGLEGWVNSGYVNLSNSDSLVHDLNYTNAHAIGSELIRWNQAGGRFYSGLFYRRLCEVNVYNYGDYEPVKYNKYNYDYPNSASGLN